MKKIINLILILPLITIGCHRAEVPQEVEQRTFRVKVMRVETGDVRELLPYVGDIKAQEEILVYSRVSGKIIENKVREGDRVKKDDIIALIDRDEVGLKFEKAPVTSPIDGTVGRVYLDRGVSVTPSTDMSTGTPIALVVDMDVMKVKVNVIESDIPKVREGQAAEISVDAYPGEVFAGKVDRVSPVVDIASRTILAEIKVQNTDHRLRPGMFARVRIVSQKHENVKVIPLKAVIGQEGKENVFVVKDNIAVMKEIKTGLRNGEMVEIRSGLDEGEEVITEGAYGVKNGARVNVEKG